MFPIVRQLEIAPGTGRFGRFQAYGGMTGPEDLKKPQSPNTSEKRRAMPRGGRRFLSAAAADSIGRFPGIRCGDAENPAAGHFFVHGQLKRIGIFFFAPKDPNGNDILWLNDLLEPDALQAGEPVEIVIRAQKFSIEPRESHQSDARSNCFFGRVKDRSYMGGEIRYVVETDKNIDLHVISMVTASTCQIGQEVALQADAADCRLLKPER